MNGRWGHPDREVEVCSLLIVGRPCFNPRCPRQDLRIRTREVKASLILEAVDDNFTSRVARRQMIVAWLLLVSLSATVGSSVGDDRSPRDAAHTNIVRYVTLTDTVSRSAVNIDTGKTGCRDSRESQKHTALAPGHATRIAVLCRDAAAVSMSWVYKYIVATPGPGRSPPAFA